MEMMHTLNQTPREIVAYLDKYIIGQADAKKAVAIALRNRWRRMQVREDLRDEILPKNIIMIGSTGIGKTEIARRMAKLVNAPFTKVEASKFTEVGYVGRDVESLIRDLVDVAINIVKDEQRERVERQAQHQVEERLLDILLPPSPTSSETENSQDPPPVNATREKFREKLRVGKLDDKQVELELAEKRGSGGIIELMPVSLNDNLDMNIKDLLSNMMPKSSKRRKIKIKEAKTILEQEEIAKLIDMEEVSREALLRVEQTGIVFLDEIDKIADRQGSQGPDVSREGVQRDLLPIVEGSTVNTKYGPVKTEHILFVAAGAFHLSKPSDLIPELQGRFPIRVELKSLTQEDFIRILTEPRNALIIQYKELLATEGVTLEFSEEAIEELAKIACQVNEQAENIGARRLHTIMEQLLEKVSFEAPEMQGEKINVTPQYIQERLHDLLQNQDLSRYIL